MKKLGRPRKAVRKENISVNLSKHIIDQIHDQLSWKSSRSSWIEHAIKSKLGNTDLLDSIEVDDIILHLYDRLPRKDHYRTLRMLYIEGTSIEDQETD